MAQSYNLTDFALRADPADNVATALREIPPGSYRLPDDTALDVPQVIPPAFKIALTDIPAGSYVCKYGQPIGRAAADIPAGTLVHVHNLASNVYREGQGAS